MNGLTAPPTHQMVCREWVQIARFASEMAGQFRRSYPTGMRENLTFHHHLLSCVVLYRTSLSDGGDCLEENGWLDRVMLN